MNQRFEKAFLRSAVPIGNLKQSVSVSQKALTQESVEKKVAKPMVKKTIRSDGAKQNAGQGDGVFFYDKDTTLNSPSDDQKTKLPKLPVYMQKLLKKENRNLKGESK